MKEAKGEIMDDNGEEMYLKKLQKIEIARNNTDCLHDFENLYSDKNVLKTLEQPP